MTRSTPPSTPPERAPLPFVRVKRVKGRDYDYFRTQRDGREINVRLRGARHSAEYIAHYNELRQSLETVPQLARQPAGSVGAMIAGYRASPEFVRLAGKTQRDYGRALDVLRALERFPARAIRRADIVKLRNKVAERSGPRAADLFVSVASRCFAIGLDLDFVDRSPVERIARIAESESHAPWPTAARRAFEASSPSPRLLTAYMIGLWTALRIGDVVRLGRQHDDGAAITIRPDKTRRSSAIELYVPVFSALRRHLATLPEGRLLFVTGDDGAPVRSDSLAKELRAHLASIGIEGLTFHGLRHTTGTALAEAGASEHEIMAVLAHTTQQMASRYTRKVQRRRLAESGMAKLEAAVRAQDREHERNVKKGNRAGRKGNRPCDDGTSR